MARERDKLSASGVAVLVVAQAEPRQLATWLGRFPQPFPVVSDADRIAYKAFGLGRISWLHFIRPTILWRYLVLMARGQRVRRPVAGEDVLQLGGDFVLDRRRRVVFAYPSRAAPDRPAIERILAAVRPGSG